MNSTAPAACGFSLFETLNDLINSDSLTPQLALKILGHFDRVVAEVLRDTVRAQMTVTAQLDTYRLCDDVWTFQLRQVNCKLDGDGDGGMVLCADRLKIVAMPSSE